MRIALVGAFDRNNYGDILMPIILEKRIKECVKNATFDYYGLSDMNMEYVKGVNTKNVAEIYNLNNYYDCVIVVGGEVLTSRYTNMYLNLQKNKVKIFVLKYLAKVFKTSIENYCKKQLNGKEIYPWIIDKSKVNCKKLIYNTVGGKKIDESEIIKNIISKVDYFAVREKETYLKIKKMNSNVKLYPDSVVSLSNVFDNVGIEKNLTDKIKNEILDLGEYYVLQVKNLIGKEIKNNLIEQIKLIYKLTGKKCVLLPIGYAQGHEDQIILGKIHKELVNETYLADKNNIYDTIFVIQHSMAYIGTSLHGAITAISYNIPHMALTNKIIKLNDFLRTWKTTPIINTDENRLCEDLKVLLSMKETKMMLLEARNNILKESDENFYNILEILKEVPNNVKG